jgi:hypothetical protein
MAKVSKKISPETVISRILKVLRLFPELAKNMPKEFGKKEFWKTTFSTNADTKRMLALFQELPAFTNLLPKPETRKGWEQLLKAPTTPQTFLSMLDHVVKLANRKPLPPKVITRWRDAFGPKEVVQRVRPTVSDKYIPNPHRGTTTFQRFQGDETYPSYFTSDTHGPVEFHSVDKVKDNVKYIPRTTLTYCRWPWAWLEPHKGKFNWKLIDSTLRVARERGQTAQLRFQPYTIRVDYPENKRGASVTPGHNDPGRNVYAIKSKRHPPERSVNVPDWYWDTGAKWVEKGVYAPNEPDSNDPKYLKHFGDFIRAFAARYDGHPDLECIDMSYAGFWGESGGNSTPATAEKLVDIYLRSFKKTQLLSMLGTPGCLHAAAVTKGTNHHIGWRADCFGDLRRVITPDVPIHLCWNHTFDAYPKEIERCGVKDAWKTAPVTMETCGNVATYFMDNHNLDLIIEEGYNYHMSVFMPKNVFFSESMMDKLVEFDKKIGYRFVLRQLLLPIEAKAGSPIALQFFVVNVGCAPIYRPYPLAIRFRQGKASHVVRLKQDIRTWLPGHNWFEEKVTVPQTLARGEAKVDLAIVDDKDSPRVWFAMKELNSDGWHPLTSIDVLK